MRNYILLLLAGVMWACGAQTERSALVDEVRQLQAEVRELKLAIAEIQLERQRAIVADIESQLERAGSELALLTAEEADRQEQLRETETHLNSPDLSNDQRADAQAIQVAQTARAGEIANRRRGLLELEAQLRRRLAQAKQQLESRLPARQ